MQEIWKTIPGFTGYEVSNLGNVRSYRLKGRGNKLSSQSHSLETYTSVAGYKTVNIHQNGERQRLYGVHRLIMFAFNGVSDQIVRHLNENPADNRIENLAYGGPMENRNDSLRLSAPAPSKIRALLHLHPNILIAGAKAALSCRQDQLFIVMRDMIIRNELT